jgi:predicted phosphodiesterase
MTAVTRIAFVSDVHGNLPALEAVLEEIDRHEPFDRVVGGGDYVAGGAFPQQSLDRMRRAGWDYVRGNADEWIVDMATGGKIPARGAGSERKPDDRTRETLQWGVEHLDDESIDFLAGLPIDWSISGPSGQKLVFVHATPTSTHPGFPPDEPENVILPMFAETGADVLLHGHIHHAYLRRIGDRVIGCVGSVGMPFDSDPRPCFLIASDDGTGWKLDHQRVTYDNEAYIADLLQSNMPHAEEPAHRIRTADR